VILTDREIKIHVERGLIKIDPRPDIAVAYNSTSVDLTLDPIISEFKEQRKGIETTIDPANATFREEEVLKDITERITIPDHGYVLRPRTFILGWTAEYIDLRDATRIAARVEGRSSLSRLGIAVHMTAPTIHAGYDGQIRLEIINHGFFPVRLRPRMRICQLIFEQTFGTPEKDSSNQFSGQTSGGT
jgi:dCTP deaminase